MKTLTTTLSRFLFAVPFLVFGFLHFMNTGDMTGVVPSWLPAPAFWVILTGIAHIGAAVCIIIKVWDYWASFLLGVMLLLFVLLIHLPALMGGDQMAMNVVLKDTALAGGAWMYTGFIAVK